ncbi:MAG: putative acyltransferase [Chthoniobacteraceae bacterium]|nr:putative acyltransferase [Chthoniobacteraceae bacterium]
MVARFSTLDALRGIAALSVCWFHLTSGNPAFLPDGFLKTSGLYGWLGVEMFFVMSGFIIPFALHRSRYSLSDYGIFLLKRVVRLDPPYLITILAIIILGFVSTKVPGFQGSQFEFSFAQVFLHFGYINVFFGYPWLNPVFWTLAIELQYYLLVGLLFPILAHRSVPVRTSTFGCLACLAFLVSPVHLLFHWLFLFMLGMAAFQFRVGLHKRKQFILWIILLGFGSWAVNGGVIAGIAIATALILGLVDINFSAPWLFFGNVSYSLYLLHVPVGGRVINLSLRFVHTMPGKLVVLVVALGVSTGAAWLLYRYVERPAQRWSSGIRYRNRPIEIANSKVDGPEVLPLQSS